MNSTRNYIAIMLSTAGVAAISLTAAAQPNPGNPGTAPAGQPAATAPSPQGANRPNQNTGPSTSSTTGLGSIKNSPLSDPAALFKRLDTNRDGKLTEEEFIGIQSALSPGTDSSSGNATKPGTGSAKSAPGTEQDPNAAKR